MARNQPIRYRLNKRYRAAVKRIYQSFFAKHVHDKTICFILGCQRSGTSLIVRVFENDLRLRVYPERSDITYENFRLRPYDQVNAIIEAANAPVVIMKPLVESQYATRLLTEFDGSRCIWMYRHFNDVAASFVEKFGQQNVIDDVRYIKDEDTTKWIGENVSEHCQQLVERHYSENMSPNTAAALKWYVRNSLYFQQKLDCDDRVKLCRYEDFVQYPSRTMRRNYDHIGAQYPGDRIVSEVNDNSLGKGSDTPLTGEVRDLCQDLYDRLEANYFIDVG